MALRIVTIYGSDGPSLNEDVIRSHHCTCLSLIAWLNQLLQGVCAWLCVCLTQMVSEYVCQGQATLVIQEPNQQISDLSQSVHLGTYDVKVIPDCQIAASYTFLVSKAGLAHAQDSLLQC